MEEVAGVKENVNPRGGLLAPSSRRLKLGGGAQEPRSRERAGVLAPNSTLGNGGGVDPLEWLKGRLSQHQSVSKSQLELDPGSRHLRKFGSSTAENGELLGGLGKPSAGLSSKKTGGIAAGKEHSSSFYSHHSPSHSRASILSSHSHNPVDNAERTTKNNRAITGVHVGGAKSPWPVSVYQDDSINSQAQRGSSRREANAKVVEVKSPGAVRLVAEGLASKSEIEEHPKIGLNPSPSGTFLSKSQLQQGQVFVKQLSPQQSHSTGSGLWNGSKRQGTPFKRKVHKSDNSVVDQPERSNVDQQNSGSGQGKGLRLVRSERARSSGTSPGRSEVSRREVMVEAAEAKSPAEADTRTGSASKSQIDDRGNKMFSSKCEEIKSRIEHLAADTVTRSASRSQISENGNQGFPTKSEEIKSRIEQHKIKLKQLYSRKPSNSSESGRSVFSNLQGPLCTYTSPMPEKEEVASSPDVKIPQCEERKLPETVFENEKDAMDFTVSLPYVSPELHLRQVYHHELGQEIDCGSRAAPCENISNYASGYSEDSANKVSLRRGSSPPPAKTQSASTLIAGSGSRKWSGSGAMSSQAEAGYSRSEHVPLYYGLKQNTSNMDVTVVGNDSAHLSAEVTAASSSGSSSTPCVMGNSSLDDVTVKSHENVLPTPSAEKAFSSYRLSAVHKLSRVNKRSGSLGPPLRVLRDEAESSNDGISPLSVAPIIGSDCSAVMEVEVGKNCRQLEHPWSDPRKRKAERDLSGGDGDTSQILEQSPSAPAGAEDKVIGGAVQAQRKCSGEPRDVGSMHKERPSSSIGKADAGEFAHPRMPSKLVERAMDLHPRISAPGRLMHSEQPSSVLITSKATTAAAYADRQSRISPAQNQNEIDASGVPSDSCKKRDRNPVPIRGGSSIGKVGLSVISPIIEPANEIQSADVAQVGGQSNEGSEMRVPATANLEDGRELAVDMSHDSFSSGENKENFGPDLSNGLNSLSLEEDDMLKKDESRLSSKISNRSSPIPRGSHSSQLNTLKSVENCHAPQSTSHSARSGVSIGLGSCGQVQILGNGSAEKPPPSASVLSENPGCELSRNTAGLPQECSTEVKVRTSPSESAQESGPNTQAQKSSHGTGKLNGQGASAAQSKISENSHFIWVNDKRYQKIGKIGKGGSSEVYKVIDSDCNIYAMKKINLKGRDHRAAIGFYQEIEYLEKLRGKRNVIQLIQYEVTNRTVVREDYEEEKILEDAYIYMVLEFGEIDLAGILSKKRKEMMENNEIIDDNWLRFYWKHMLLAVKTIHDERIVHADLKPANFLLVQGELKLIDFGIAKAIQSDTTHIVRDSNNMVGTVNYMSPEALMTNSLDDKGEMVKCGRASDIWSLGCILYQMVYGHTPFSHVTSFFAKIQAITSKNHRIEFPNIPDPWLQDVMKKCLIWDRHSRPQITELLEHPFLRPGLANQQN